MAARPAYMGIAEGVFIIASISFLPYRQLTPVASKSLTGKAKPGLNDNVNSPMHQEWLKQVVDKEDLTRHDKWLCMIWPRLRLLRELLRDDGVIFISIDDNEAHRLRMVMDEIFGEHNFVANIVWQKKQSPQNDATYLVRVQEVPFQ